MEKMLHNLYITIAVEGSSLVELDELARGLKKEIEDLAVDSVDKVSTEFAPDGTKSADWANIGQMVVTLAPIVIPPLFELLQSWVERRPSVPVKIRIRVGKKSTQIEYDPTKTTAKDLDALIKSLGKSVKK